MAIMVKNPPANARDIRDIGSIPLSHSASGGILGGGNSGRSCRFQGVDLWNFGSFSGALEFNREDPG